MKRAERTSCEMRNKTMKGKMAMAEEARKITRCTTTTVTVSS